MSPCTNRTPIDCTRPASSASIGSSVTPPGTSTHGRSWVAASAIIIAGSPLSHVATPSTPRRVGSERMRRRKTVAASLRYGRLSNIAGVPCERPSHGSVHDAGERNRSRAREFSGRRFHQQPDFPVTGVISKGDRRSVRCADSTVGREHQELPPSECRGVPAHAGVLRPAEEIARRAFPEHLRGQWQRADGTGRVCRDVEERWILRVEGVGGHAGMISGLESRFRRQTPLEPRCNPAGSEDPAPRVVHQPASVQGGP